MKKINRTETTQFMLGNLVFGGSKKIYIQSMLTTKTSKTDIVINEINELTKIGLEIIRVSIIDQDDLDAIPIIRNGISVPLICDIHFNAGFAFTAIRNGADAIRINPANYPTERLKELFLEAIKFDCGVRIGFNRGGFHHEMTTSDILEEIDNYVKVAESVSFKKLCISMKSTSVKETIDLNIKLAEIYKYPIHLGLTEAGPVINSTINHTIVLSQLLKKGIGSTIRISISDDPKKEVMVARQLLSSLGFVKDLPNLISCPTCGRISYDMFSYLRKIEEIIYLTPKKITIAVMGCIVNGIGEAKYADLAVIGFNNEIFHIYKRGELFLKVKKDDLLEKIIEEINNF